MERAKVVVRAAISGYTIREKPGETQYAFNEGATGILSWEWHEEDPAYLQPLVKWDEDPEQLPRYVSFSVLEMLGIEQNGIRFCLGCS